VGVKRSLSPALVRSIAVFVCVVAALFALYTFWFRSSGFVRVKHVTVTGVSIRDGARLSAALTNAALGTSVLDVPIGKLETVASPYKSVRKIEASAQSFHDLKLRVVEYQPAAVAVGPDRRPVALTINGELLEGFPLDRPLPLFLVAEPVAGSKLSSPDGKSLLDVYRAAPAELAGRITQMRSTSKDGVVASVAGSGDIVFGDPSQSQQKWASAVRVLADPAASGALYVDVRLPDRPAAGHGPSPASGM
jgi:cell division protein FtsQ